MDKKNIYLITGILAIIIVGFLFFSGGNNPGVTGEVISDNPDLIGDPDKVTIYFFWGDGCPHCATQKPYLEKWAEEYGDNIEIKMFETWKNPENVPLFQEVAGDYGIQAKGVPTTFIGEKYWVGFSSSMAPEMEEYIEYCIENTCETPIIN